jgi:hypothetical protein
MYSHRPLVEELRAKHTVRLFASATNHQAQTPTVEMYPRLPKRTLAVVAALAIAASLLLSLRTVEKRVVCLNLDTVFPTLSDTYKSGTQLKTFSYPCIVGHRYYYIRTTNGSVRIEIELCDYSRVPYFRQYKVGSPSQPIGEESFYEIAHPSHSEDLMDLVYQRHNVTAFFRQEPIHGLPGRPYAYSDQGRQQVEQLARTLDDAVERGGSGVTLENVHGYEILSHAIRNSVGGLCFLVWALIVRLLGKDIHF